MLVGCMIFYDEAWILKRTLKALKERVGKVIAVDGPYEHFPHEKTRSVDGSCDIAEQLADVVILPDRRSNGWHDEMEKRNSYLKFVRPGDWVVVVDADEELQGAFPRLHGQAYRIRMHERSDPVTMELFRVFKMGSDTRYVGAHFCVFEDETLLNNVPMSVLKGVDLVHHRLDRPRERSKRKGPYLDWLKEHEREFRETWKPLT